MCTKLRVNLFLIVLIGSIFYYYIGKCEMQTNLKSQDFDGTNIKNDNYSEDLMSIEIFARTRCVESI